MEIGNNLKKLRTSKGMTQKDLADSLNVSSQAVSRWENNEVEPDISTLSKLSSIFGVPVDTIINGETAEKKTAEEKAEAVAAVAAAVSVASEAKKDEEEVAIKSTTEENTYIGTCSACGKALHAHDKYNKISTPAHTAHRRGHKYTVPASTRYYCAECEVLRQKGKLSSAGKKLPKFGKKRLVFGLVFGLVVLIGLMIAFFAATSMSPAACIFLPILLGYGVFATIYCLFTECYIGEVFVEIATWSVKFPGIIFTFDLDGFAFLIVMKILFAILGALIGIGVFLLAVSISMFLSLFTFPFVIGREAI